MRKIVRLRGNFLTRRFGWKILHLQFAICFNRSNYLYTITITTNRFWNVFKDFRFCYIKSIDNRFWKVNPQYFTKYLLSLFGFSNIMYKLLVILFVIKLYARKQPTSTPPRVDNNRHLSKKLISLLFKSPSKILHNMIVYYD